MGDGVFILELSQAWNPELKYSIEVFIVLQWSWWLSISTREQNTHVIVPAVYSLFSLAGPG